MAILEILESMQMAAGKNRLVIVLDGMGTVIVKKLLPADGFFNRHMVESTRAIFPPTTVAATTAYRTGKLPCQTEFIGWAQYFAETDEVVEMFRNTNYYTGDVSKLPQHSGTMPCPRVVAAMNDSGRRAVEIMPAFEENGCATFEEWLDKIVDTCNRETDAYIYAYWTEPDHSLHYNGTTDAGVRATLREMEEKTESALGRIKNHTDILITADHGHRDQENLFLEEDFPDVAECLLHPLSVEPRCAALFIRPEKMAEFPELFNRHFGAHFKLVPKAEFEREYLHCDHPIRFVGDFMAVATGDYSLCQNRNVKHFKSNHAGATDDELQIPIIKLSV